MNKLRRRSPQMKDSRPQHCPGNNVTVEEQMKYCSLGIATVGNKINALHKACGHRFCKDACKRVLRVPDTSVSHSPEPHPTSTFELAAEIPPSPRRRTSKIRLATRNPLSFSQSPRYAGIPGMVMTGVPIQRCLRTSLPPSEITVGLQSHVVGVKIPSPGSRIPGPGISGGNVHRMWSDMRWEDGRW